MTKALNEAFSYEGPESKPPIKQIIQEHLRRVKDFVRRILWDDETDLDPNSADTFEAEAARCSLKFEAGYIAVEVLAVAIYSIVAPGRAWPCPGVYIWPAGFFSIVVRILAFGLRVHGRFPPHVLSMLLILMDVMLLTTCHPNVSMLFWWENDPPASPTWGHMMMGSDKMMNMNASQAQEMVDNQTATMEAYQLDLDQWELDLESYDKLKDDEATMVMYSLQILIWYSTTFVLLLRHAWVVVLLTIVGYSTSSLCMWHGTVVSDRSAVLELTMQIFSFTVALVVKSRSESSQRKLFHLLQDRKKLAIEERVKRYEAEFANEQLTTLCPEGRLLQIARKADLLQNLQPGTGNVKGAGGKGTPSVVSSALSSILKPPPSTMSAPPALHEGPMLKPQRRSGECLPPDAVVWIEGQSLPQPVSSVAPGDKVLCYDSLGLCPKYVDVMESKMIAGQAAWVVVSLEDGTTLTLTADHPTQPRRAIDQLPFSSHVAAADLSPASDSLMVLKMLPVPVSSVQPLASDRNERVALSLRQPERHEVFVAPKGGTPGQDIATVAVGSADAPTQGGDRGARNGVGLTVKRTFIDLEDDDGSLSRATSCPPRVRYHEREARRGASPGPRDRNGGAAAKRPYAATGIGSAGGPALVKALESTGTFNSLRRSMSESDLASQSSKMSSTPTDVDILVAVTNQDSAAKVSEIMEVRKAGLPSVGTTQHECGNCQPCIFESRFHRGEGGKCFKGLLCERCHECHDAVGRRKRVPGGTRNLRKIHQRRVEQYQHEKQQQYERLLPNQNME